MNDKLKQPAIRFNGFEDEWEEKQLNQFLTVSKAKNKLDTYGKEDVLSVSGEFGIVNQIEFQGRSFAGSSLKNYGIVENGDIVYTKSPLKTNPFGIIKTNKRETGIVSPLYALYKTTNISNPNFIQIYFDLNSRINNYMRPLVHKGAKNEMQVTPDNALKGKVIFPSYSEMGSIVKLFDKLDDLIVLKQEELDYLQSEKGSLLKKMFPKKGEKIPELRFEGFTEPWVEKKIFDEAEIITGGTPKTKVADYWFPKEIPWLSSGEVHKKYINYTDNFISQKGLDNSSAKLVVENSILIALAGQGKTRGTVAINSIPVSTNQSIAAICFNNKFFPMFVLYNLELRYEELRKLSSGDGSRGGLNKKLIGEIKIPYTSLEEQEKIGQFFKSIDKEIQLKQEELEQLKSMKQSLLKAMFI